MNKVSKAEAAKLSAKQLEELKALHMMPDSEIDYSDDSQVASDAWQGAIVGRFYKPMKQQLTLRIDADVVAWFKSQGRGYQTRINELLRREMLNEVEH